MVMVFVGYGWGFYFFSFVRVLGFSLFVGRVVLVFWVLYGLVRRFYFTSNTELFWLGSCFWVGDGFIYRFYKVSFRVFDGRSFWIGLGIFIVGLG